MLKSLTSFRFVAAFMVYLTHSVSYSKNYNLGYAGVSFFFVLSGFILAFNYHSKFKELNRKTIKKFYLARFAKVYPVYFLTLIISIPYMGISYFYLHKALPTGLDFFSGFVVNLFMIQSFIPLPFGTMPYTFNPVSWSLSDEIFFYIVFPFIVYLFLKLKGSARMLKNFIFTSSFFIGIICITVISSFFIMKDWYFYVFPVFRSLDFIMGILMGLLFVTRGNQDATVNKSLFNVLEIFSLILFAGWILFSPYISLAFKYSVYYVPMWCLLIFIFAFQGGIVSKILSNKWLVFLGEISFSFYMVHLLVINYVSLLHLGSFTQHFITFFGSILLSATIYFMYEEPLRKRIRFGAKNKEKLQQEVSPNVVKV